MTVPFEILSPATDITVDADIEITPRKLIDVSLEPIDKDIVSAIQKLPVSFLETLSAWLEKPSDEHYPALKVLSDKLRPLYEEQKVMLVRSFDTTPENAYTMGHNFAHVVWKDILQDVSGAPVGINTKSPVSMTVDHELAGMIGRFLVGIQNDVTLFDNNLPITNELIYAINLHQGGNGSELLTQREVVIFPGNYTVSVKSKNMNFI